MVTLLCLSSSDFGGADHGCVDHGGGEGAVELAGDVALEAAADLAGGLALGGAAGDVGPGALGQQRMRVMAMVCRARLSARSPPRLSRWRTVRPLLASRGLVPARAANAASLRQRPGWEKQTMAWAALTGPMPRRSVSPGARSSTMACSWARLALSARAAVAQGEGEAADLAVSHGLVAVASRGGGGGPARSGQCSGSAPRASLAVGVVAAEQQRAQPVGLRGAGRWSGRGGRRAGSAALRGPRRRAGSVAGRRPGAAPTARPGARRSGRTCPARGGSCGGAARTR